MAKGKKQGGDGFVIPRNRRKASSKWQSSHGTFITGQSFVDEVTLVADRVESKWGVGRVRMLVGPELRDKFDRQRYLFNQALWFGELEDVRVQSGRMIKAWNALDKAADELGHKPKPADVWDVISPEGNVYAIARNDDEAKAYRREDGKPVRLFSVEEICRVLDAQGMMGQIKDHFPEAEITDFQDRAIGDVLDDIWTSQRGLDDKLDDEMPV